MVGLGLGFKNQDWIWIAKCESPLIFGNDQDWIRTEGNFGSIRIGSDCNFFLNWRIRTGLDGENSQLLKCNFSNQIEVFYWFALRVEAMMHNIDNFMVLTLHCKQAVSAISSGQFSGVACVFPLDSLLCFCISSSVLVIFHSCLVFFMSELNVINYTRLRQIKWFANPCIQHRHKVAKPKSQGFFFLKWVTVKQKAKMTYKMRYPHFWSSQSKGDEQQSDKT